MNYVVTGEQLTGIADQLRVRTKKNLLNPETMKAEGLPTGKYTFSMKATVANEHQETIRYIYMYGTQPGYEDVTWTSVGERISFGISLSANVSLTFTTDSYFTDYMLEHGETASEYEPYDRKLVFPNDFTDAIDELKTLIDWTSDATATAGQIRNGRTAYVKGEKIIGTYLPQVNKISKNSSRNKSVNRSTAYVANSELANMEFTAAEYVTSNLSPNLVVKRININTWDSESVTIDQNDVTYTYTYSQEQQDRITSVSIAYANDISLNSDNYILYINLEFTADISVTIT